MGLTILDAGVVIAVLDSADAHHAAAVQSLSDAAERGDRFVVPASAYAEVLSGRSERAPEHPTSSMHSSAAWALTLRPPMPRSHAGRPSFERDTDPFGYPMRW